MYVLDGINFYCGDILKFQEKKYDMISLLSAFHYFRDKQKNLLEKIYSLLNDNGLFIIEIGLSLDHLEISFVEKYTRMGVDLEPCHFPNEKAFHDMISGLFEIVFTGDSIQQSGDRLPRKVFHLKKILI